LAAGLRSDPLGELTALPIPLAEFNGPTSMEREREGMGRRGDGCGRGGRSGERRGNRPTRYWPLGDGLHCLQSAYLSILDTI